MIGKSPAINQLRSTIDKVAPTNSRIMLRGASGSGKELAARVLHQKSLRADGPFVVLNAAAMVPDRVEEELFGTEDRTGGPRKVGALEEAHRRHALYRRSRRHADGDAGQDSARSRRAEIPAPRRRAEGVRRCAHHLLDQPRPRAGHARRAVSARISIIVSNVVPLRVPSLAERREDIPELIQYFIGQVAPDVGPRAAPDRRRRDRGAAGPRLAGQRSRTPQQRRAAADPRRRRAECRHHGRHAARGDRLERAVAGQRRRRASDVAAAARGARNLRARISAGADQPLRRQHFPHGRVRRHGALGAAPKAQSARRLVRATRR